MDHKHLSTESLAKWFVRFAESECREVSPMYHYLSHEIANDPDLLHLAAHSRQGQPVPNLLLAAVHYLLLRQRDGALAAHYPSLNPGELSLPPFPLFKSFALAHADRIVDILRTRIVQTNALNRTAYLMPVFSALPTGQSPVNLVDIGASAGLMLNLDLYQYDYSDDRRYGDSAVEITTEIRGGRLPAFPQMLRVQQKTGIDQNPLDLSRSEDATWLKALIWPDQKARFMRLQEAITLAVQQPVRLEKGQRIEDFARILHAQDTDTPLIVYHTHVLYQFPEDQRHLFWQMLDEFGRQRDLYYLAAEAARILPDSDDYQGVLVQLTTYRRGEKERRPVALTNGHANWVRWL